MEELERLASSHESLDPENYFIMYDAFTNAIRANCDFWGQIIVKIVEQRFFPQNHWLAGNDLVDCIEN